MKNLLMLAGLLAGIPSFSQLYLLPVYAVASLQPAEPGNETSKAIDGDSTTLYHSEWGKNGIPDELLFYFASLGGSIKKIVYTPRLTGNNGIWTNVSVYYSTQNDPGNFILITGNLAWGLNHDEKEIDLAEAIQNPYAVKFVIHAGAGNFSSCAEMRFYSEQQNNPSNGIDCIIPTAGLSVNGANDIEAAVFTAGSIASSFQPGANISLSFDNDVNTLYHSSWNNTVFPVLLNYALNGNSPIDYLKYTPRSDGGTNGNFGNVIISYNTLSNSSFMELMNFNFEQSEVPVIVQFPFQITPLNVRISVQDGAGGFASCAEMEFYKNGSSGSTPPYSGIFNGDIYSELFSAITQTEIDTISSPFYQSLAQCIFDETYVRQYRVQSYEVYPTLSSIRNNLKIGQYDACENQTGIVFTQEEKIALFARDIPAGAGVYLMVKDFATELEGVASYYTLHNGLNVFNVTNSGLGYLNYFNNDSTLADIRINIVSGKINGYFDHETSSVAEWPASLINTVYPVIDIRGEYAHLVYEKAALRDGVPFNPLALIGKYDTIIRHERMLMGLYKYNKSPKNRQLTYGNHGGGYYAGGWGVNLDMDWGSDALVDPDNLSLWGIPHEYGHINQIRPDLKWIGTTEVTNNIYSVWVQYQMNPEHTPYARLESSESIPASGIAAIEGGLINGAIYNTHVNGEHLQGNSNYDVFEILVPFWQLELYYQLAGASRNAPVLSFDYPQDYTGTDYAHWYGMVAEMCRNTNSEGLSNGELLLNFVKNTCDAVEEDLTPFFRNAGFLKPIDIEIDDYGVGQLTITQAQIDATVAYIQSKNYPAPVSPVIDYISAHSLNMFKNQLPLSGQTGTGVFLSNNYLNVQHTEWHNAVAYETYNSNGELIYVSISGSGDVSNQTTSVYYPADAASVYAVGFDEQRILVYPASTVSINKETSRSTLQIYPNPVSQNSPVHLVLKKIPGNYAAKIIGVDGRIVFTLNGTIDNIEQAINKNLINYRSGVYILSMKDALDVESRVRFIKE